MQYVLITGVSSGIGHALAVHLLERGFFVFGSVRREADARELEDRFGSHFKALLFDVREGSTIAQAALEVERILDGQPLTALVNNAGIAVNGPLQHLPIEEVREQLEVNVLGVLRVTQAFLPLLGARQPVPDQPGRIINISSVSGTFTNPFLAPYAASKHALESLTDGLRRELLPYGIDVISVQPGPIQTAIWKKSLDNFRYWEGTIYEPILQGGRRSLERTISKALPPERVARLLHRIITSRRPRTRYQITPTPLMVWIHRYLPTRWVDGIYRVAFGRMLKRKGKSQEIG